MQELMQLKPLYGVENYRHCTHLYTAWQSIRTTKQWHSI